MKSTALVLTLIVLVIVAVILVPRLAGGGGVAPTPAVFDTGVTLDQALERSQTSGRPVFALVTADWCPPCQSLKRGALTDERVTKAIESSTEPVYVTDKSGHDVGRLGVRAFPTSVIIRDGEVVASLEGAASAGRYLEWLETNAATPEAGAAP